MKCKCGKTLTDKMEVEYSSWINEFFCSPECATDRYFDFMHSTPVDFSQPLPENVIVIDGLLICDVNGWNK